MLDLVSIKKSSAAVGQLREHLLLLIYELDCFEIPPEEINNWIRFCLFLAGGNKSG